MHLFRRTILILFPLFVIVLFCFLYITSPKNIDYDAIELETLLPFKIEEFHTKSINYEAQFEEIFATRQLISEDHELLHNAIVYQQKYIDNLPFYRKAAFERINRFPLIIYIFRDLSFSIYRPLSKFTNLKST